MPRTSPPLAVAVLFLRGAAGWSREELASAAGTTSKRLSEWESGNRPLSSTRAEALVALLGFAPEVLKDVVAQVAFLRAQGGSQGGASEDGAGGDEALAVQRLGFQLGRIAAEEVAAYRATQRAERLRADAARLWSRVQKMPPAARRALVLEAARAQTWAFAERLGEASVEAACRDEAEALALAELALLCAERVSGEEKFRALAQANAWAFLGNARRVAGDLSEASRAFDRLAVLAREGDGGDPLGHLDSIRRLDLEASLRKSQGRFREALVLIDQALARRQGEAAARLLVMKATVFEQAAEPELALDALREAAGFLKDVPGSRYRAVLRFSTAVNLCQLGRYAEAATAAENLSATARNQGRELDAIRAEWLVARIAAGLGRSASALDALTKIEAAFAIRAITYDAALVALERTAVLLDLARFEAAADIARDLIPYFRTQSLPRDLLAALDAYGQALGNSRATARVARELIRFLEAHRPRGGKSIGTP